MKKTILILSVCLALALALAGCASNADGSAAATPGMTTPGLSPSASPGATDGGMLGEADKSLSDLGETLTGQGVTTAEEALAASKSLRDAVQKLTEVDTAVAVVTGATALVGVNFDASYKGEADERFMSMVLDRAQAVSAGIRSVAVTADAKAVEEIASLYQLLQGGSPYTTVKAEADALAKDLDVYRKE